MNKTNEPIIAIDARTLLQKQRGMPTYVFYLCKLLPKMLPEIQFVLLINKGFEYNEDESDYLHRLHQCENPNVNIINIECEEELYWEQVLLVKYLKNNKVDLLHMPCNRCCLRTSTKQIVTYHDTMEWDQLRLWDFIKELPIRKRLYTNKMRVYMWFNYVWGMRKSAHILTISKFAESSILHAFKHVKEKISHVYHGIPDIYLDNADVSMLSKRNFVFMLGGESHQKNSENMLLAYAKLPVNLRKEFPLFIAGVANLKDSKIVRKVRSLGLEKDVHIESWVSENRLVSLFSNARCFLFASRVEGFGFPLIQSMARGTPVVTSTAEVLIELGQNAIKTSDADDTELMSKNIESILVDDETFTQMQKQSLSIAKLFSWQTTIEHIANLYIEQINVERL